jgi:hypothetical protein
MNNELGRVAEGEQALVNEAPTGLHPTGFDPSRDPRLCWSNPAPDAAAGVGPGCFTITISHLHRANIQDYNHYRCGKHGWMALGVKCPQCEGAAR